MDGCRLKTGWEPWVTFHFQHHHTSDEMRCDERLWQHLCLPSTKRWIILLSWGEQHLSRDGPPGKGVAMPRGHPWPGLRASFGAQGELQGLQHSRFLGAGTAALPHAQGKRLQSQTEPGTARHAGFISEKKADLPDTRQPDLCGCSFLPVLQWATASPSLRKKQLWVLLAV